MPQTGHVDVYFFISHVRNVAPNRWISACYEDLKTAVEARATPRPGLRPESIYLETRAVAERRRAAGDLASARVFVPLYTREYLHQVPPEFDEYVHGDPARPRRPVIHPVLWDGDFGIRNAPGLSQARDLGDGIALYEEGGLAAMRRVRAYAVSYQRIIDRLAERIVTAAEDPDNVPVWVGPDSSMIIDTTRFEKFVIAILSPQGRQWHPFGGTGHPTIIELAAETTRQYTMQPDIQEHHATAADGGSPGVLLIDIWSLDDERLRAAAMGMLRNPPPGMGRIVIAESRGGDDDARLRDRLIMVSDISRGAIDVARSRPQYNQVISKVIHRVRNDFVREHPTKRPPEA
jgi:hypothetical protein